MSRWLALQSLLICCVAYRDAGVQIHQVHRPSGPETVADAKAVWKIAVDKTLQVPSLLTRSDCPAFESVFDITINDVTTTKDQFLKVFEQPDISGALVFKNNISQKPRMDLVEIAWRAILEQDRINKDATQIEDEMKRKEFKQTNACWQLLVSNIKHMLKPERNKAAFWSGGIHTSYYARSKGRNTLENRPGAHPFDLMDKNWGADGRKELGIPWSHLGVLWNRMSVTYAQQCARDVELYVRMLDTKSVLYRQEFPQLLLLHSKGIIQLHYVFVMGATPDRVYDEATDEENAAESLLTTGRFSHDQMKKLAAKWDRSTDPDSGALQAAFHLLGYHYFMMKHICGDDIQFAIEPGELKSVLTETVHDIMRGILTKDGDKLEQAYFVDVEMMFEQKSNKLAAPFADGKECKDEDELDHFRRYCERFVEDPFGAKVAFGELDKLENLIAKARLDPAAERS